jgi:hypothetical protein
VCVLFFGFWPGVWGALQQAAASSLQLQCVLPLVLQLLLDCFCAGWAVAVATVEAVMCNCTCVCGSCSFYSHSMRAVYVSMGLCYFVPCMTGYCGRFLIMCVFYRACRCIICCLMFEAFTAWCGCSAHQQVLLFV